MTSKEPVEKSRPTAEWFVRGALSRLGETLDRFTGRNWVPTSSLATSELIQRLLKLLDSEAREAPGKGLVVPHNIRLKIQWDKFATDSGQTVERLEQELLAAAADHINDSLYYTYAPLQLQVKPDYFVDGVKFYAGFDDMVEDEREVAMDVTIAGIDLRPDLATEPEERAVESPVVSIGVKYTINGVAREKSFEVPTGGRISVGRAAKNDLVLDDPNISKFHASLIADDEGGVSIADTGSTNGTFVNGERISYGKTTRLEEGDKVRFGTLEVVLSLHRHGRPPETSLQAEDEPEGPASETVDEVPPDEDRVAE